MAKNTSEHILGTAADLLGFCLFVITSLHITNTSETSIIDEITSIIAVLLTIACLFSFISIRTENKRKQRTLETIADYVFISSLSGILVIILLITFNYVK